MNIILLIVFLSIAFLFGWYICGLLIDGFISREEHIGLSLPVGLGIHAIIYYLFFSLFKNIPNNLIILLIETLFLLIIFRFPKARHLKIRNERLNKIQALIKKIVMVILFFSIFYTMLQALYWPIWETDALKLFDYRAKRLLEGNLDSFTSFGTIGSSHLYPPLTSLLHFFVYQMGLSNPRFIYGLFFVFFTLTFYGYLKRVLESSFWGLIVTTLIVITPSVWWNSFLALPNSMYTCFFSLSIIYLFKPTRSSKRITSSRFIFLPSIILGLATWARSELFWIVPAIIYIFNQLFRLNFKKIILFSITLLILVYLWPISLKKPAEGPTNQVVAEIQVVQRIKPAGTIEVLTFFTKPLFNSWNVIPIIFLVIIFLQYWLMRKPPSLLQFVTFLIILAILFAIVNFSVRYPRWRDLDSSFYRLATMVVPLFWISIATSPLWGYVRRNFARDF